MLLLRYSRIFMTCSYFVHFEGLGDRYGILFCTSQVIMDSAFLTLGIQIDAEHAEKLLRPQLTKYPDVSRYYWIIRG